MLMEDKADLVREAVIKSLGIIMGYIDDPDKYQQVSFGLGSVCVNTFYRYFKIIEGGCIIIDDCLNSWIFLNSFQVRKKINYLYEC